MLEESIKVLKQLSEDVNNKNAIEDYGRHCYDIGYGYAYGQLRTFGIVVGFVGAVSVICWVSKKVINVFKEDKESKQ